MQFSHFFRPREKFLILEIRPQGASGLFLSVDDDRNLIVEKYEEHLDLKKFFKSPARRVARKTWEGETLFKSHRRVIAAADSSLATTIPIPLELARESASARAKLMTPELENMIAQAMAKIFNGCRSEAARRLGLNDLDAVLVGANAKHFKVDGKSAVNPLGLPGKRVSFLLELTFTGREIFEDLKPFFNAPDHFFFAEAPQARLNAISRVRDLPLNLVEEADGGTALYILQKAKDDYAVLYREKLDWSFAGLVREIMKNLAVTEGIAKELYRRYRKGEMSEASARAFQKMILPAVDAFLREVARAKVRGEVYFDVPYLLPFPLPHKHGTAKASRHPMGEIFVKLGFTAGPWMRQLESGEANHLLRPLLYFIEAYFDRTNSEINQKLRRRLHWLAG